MYQVYIKTYESRLPHNSTGQKIHAN